MNKLHKILDSRNSATLKRRDEFRIQIAQDPSQSIVFQKLKHEFPFIGFVDCEVEDISFILFSCNDDVVAWEYFWLGAYEPELVSNWIKWSKNAQSILDIGAYTGLMSILAALANPTAEIHAMEPVDRTVERMKINLRANGVSDRVHTYPKAAAAVYGVEMINFYRDEDFLGTGNSLYDKGKPIFNRRIIETVNVDHYLGSKSRFDLIKIDVEGFEFSVLQSLTRIIRRDRPKLIVEVWEESKSDVLSFLESFGYWCTALEDSSLPVVNYLCEIKS